MNADIKRHIDSARQVLVGVVPNPTSQIEQITTTLIYKFMDDMDQAAIKAGGEPSFFIGDLEKYAWTRLMDSRVGNQDKMNLYVEALSKFSESKQLPELFRNIFKSAFLPYRSPEVLGLFLKEVGVFDYSHPEDLGDAYEYLLSIMSSQGDAGQFRTPRHIIDFIVKVVNPTKDDKILDPACGTAGFLISAYKHILAQHDEKDDLKKEEKPLTPDQRKNLMNNIEGYDIDPAMVRIAQVNMYLHQFKNPKIYQYDSLSMEGRWNDKFDIILANPPFMSPKGGIKPHSKFSIRSNRSEVLFVDYIKNHLKPRGRAGFVVPEGIIFDSKAKELRKRIIHDDCLWAIVSLPQGVFNPYTDAKTNIMFFDKELSSKMEDLMFIEVENDGFDLGLQRKRINKNDLPEVEDLLTKMIQGEKIIDKRVTWINKKKIFEDKGHAFNPGHYHVRTNVLDNIRYIPLKNILIRNKDSILIKDDQYYKRITIKMHGKGISQRDVILGSNIGTKKQFVVRAGQLVLSKIDARNGAFGIVPEELDNAIITGNFWAYDINNLIDTDKYYLNYILFSEEFRKICSMSSSGVTNRRYLDEELFLNQEIPLPKLDIQLKKVEEIRSIELKMKKLENELNQLKFKVQDIICELWK